MKYRIDRFNSVARLASRLGLQALALGALTSLGAIANAQTPAVATPPERLNWHGDPGAPDLSGVWVLAESPTAPRTSREGWQPWPPPLKGRFATTWKKRVADAAAGKRTDDPVRGCLPPGMPRYLTGTRTPLLIMQTPKRITLYRDGDTPKRIWLDGRSFPSTADLEAFPNGNSIGRYEGQDLVIESIGLTDLPIDSTGVPHSDQLKIVTRYHRVDGQTLRISLVLTDPEAFSRPMTATVLYRRYSDPLWEPQEFICTPDTDYHPEIYVR